MLRTPKKRAKNTHCGGSGESVNISARHIGVIVPALSPAPRDVLTETPIPLRRGLFRL